MPLVLPSSSTLGTEAEAGCRKPLQLGWSGIEGRENEMAAIDRHLDTRDAGKPVELGLIKHPKTDIREPRASRATQPPV